MAKDRPGAMFVRLSEKEKRLLKLAAKVHGMEPHAYARAVLLRDTVRTLKRKGR